MFGIQCEKTYSIAMVFIITVYSTLGIEFIFYVFPYISWLVIADTEGSYY